MHDNAQLQLFEPGALGFPVADTLVDKEGYLAGVRRAEKAFNANPCAGSAIDLSKAMIAAAMDHVQPDAVLAVSTSWGKDSSALVGLIAEVAIHRRDSGFSVPPIVIAVADTGNEFPEMAARVRDQNEKFERWAKREGLDVEAFISSPRPHQSLYALLAGAGYALPGYAAAKTANVSSWCVDRLKVQPMRRVLEGIRARSTRFVQVIGVRSAESSKRAATIEDYSRGLPRGLSRLGTRDETDHSRLALQPIEHWDHETLRVYLRDTMALWDPWSFESLKTIYRKGADPDELEGASECSIVRTAEGGVSNVCSDLSGARFGCVTCVKSRNRSLHNTSRRDRRYRWVRAVHSFIYRGVSDHKARLAEIRAMGLSNADMFCRGYTFAWRYRLLMLIFRAEAESGFSLISPEELIAVQQHWERSGVFTVVPADAKRDAEAWKLTGRMVPSYEADSANYDDMATCLPDGLPGGVFAHLRYPDTFSSSHRLSIANLLAFAGKGSSLYPRLRAHVFRDTIRGGWITLLGDCPSDMGKRINTDGMSGFEGFGLELDFVRDPTAREKKLMRGRIVMYRTTQADITRVSEQIRAGSTATRSLGGAFLHEVVLALMDRNTPCGEKELIDHLDQGHFIAELNGKLSSGEFKQVFGDVERATELSELVTDEVDRFRREHNRLLKAVGVSSLASDKHGGDKAIRDAVNSSIKEAFPLDDCMAIHQAFADSVQCLAEHVRAGRANTETINRLTYIVRTSWYDHDEAQRLLMELSQQLVAMPDSRAIAA